MRLEDVDPATVSDDDLLAWHACLAAAMPDVYPDEPMPPVDWIAVRVRNPGEFCPYRLSLAWDDARTTLLGGLETYWYLGSNTHMIEIEPWVDPAVRRRGVGRALVEHARAMAKADGRTVMHSGAPYGTPGLDFADAIGGRRTLDEYYSRVLLHEVDLATLVVPTIDGISVTRWVDHCPDELVASYAALIPVIDTAPTGDIDWRPDPFDVARVRSMEDQFLAQGQHRWSLAARDDATGELVGYTEVTITDTLPQKGDQEATAVYPDYRGRGIATLVKAGMVQWLRVDRPQLEVVTTWNAVENTAMLAVNAKLGYGGRRKWSHVDLDV